MEVYIISPADLKPVGVIDDPPSLIWRRQYQGAGYFEIYAPATPDNLALLRRGMLVRKGQDPEAGIITYLHIQDDPEQGATITAQGTLLTGLLARRVMAAPLNLDGNIEDAIRQLVTDNATAPINPARTLPWLTLGEPGAYPEAADVYVPRRGLLDAVTGLLQIGTLGIRAVLQSAAIVLEVYKGLDRSEGQSVNPRAVFSEEYDTLLGMQYTADSEGEINAVLATSAGMVEELGGDAVGWDRCEAFVEVEPVIYTVTSGEDTYERISTTATRRNMRVEAEKLLAAPPPEVFEGNVLTGTGSLVYRQDYDLGDVVTVRSSRFGLASDVRITAIDEVYDEEGPRVIPTFGSPLAASIDIFKG